MPSVDVTVEPGQEDVDRIFEHAKDSVFGWLKKPLTTIDIPHIGEVPINRFHAITAGTLGYPFGVGLLQGMGRGVGQGVASVPRYLGQAAASGVGAVARGAKNLIFGKPEPQKIKVDTSGFRRLFNEMRGLNKKGSMNKIAWISPMDATDKIINVAKGMPGDQLIGGALGSLGSTLAGTLGPIAAPLLTFLPFMALSRGISGISKKLQENKLSKAVKDPKFQKALQTMQRGQTLKPLGAIGGALLANLASKPFIKDPITRGLISGLGGLAGTGLAGRMARPNVQGLNPIQTQLLAQGGGGRGLF